MGSIWCSTRPLADIGSDYNLHHALKLVKHRALRVLCASLTSVHGVDHNQCLCLPKAELNAKSNPNDRHSLAIRVRFDVQLDLLEKK